jgi:hypothetical protein
MRPRPVEMHGRHVHPKRRHAVQATRTEPREREELPAEGRPEMDLPGADRPDPSPEPEAKLPERPLDRRDQPPPGNPPGEPDLLPDVEVPEVSM